MSWRCSEMSDATISNFPRPPNSTGLIETLAQKRSPLALRSTASTLLHSTWSARSRVRSIASSNSENSSSPPTASPSRARAAWLAYVTCPSSLLASSTSAGKRSFSARKRSSLSR